MNNFCRQTTQEDHNWQPYGSPPGHEQQNGERQMVFIATCRPLWRAVSSFEWGSKQRYPHTWNLVGRKTSETIDVLGIWTSNMNPLISEDIREHYERRTLTWQWGMMRTLHTDIPDLNDTPHVLLTTVFQNKHCTTPFPEKTGPSDGLPFVNDTEMQEETPRGSGVGIANRRVAGNDRPLTVKGSSVSSRGSETLEAYITEPMTYQSNNNRSSSSESRNPRQKFKRPSLYILRCREEGDGDPRDTLEQRGTKRTLSDEDRSSSESEFPRQQGADVRPSTIFDRDDSAEFPPHSRGPDLGGCNDDSSDNEYKLDDAEALWALRQCQIGDGDPRKGPWRRPPGNGGREPDEYRGTGIVDVMQDKVLTRRPTEGLNRLTGAHQCQVSYRK